MNTSHKGVKAIFLAILLALTVSFSVTPRAEAQTFSTEQHATLDQLNQTLITLLTELIAQLQAQITTLIAEQTNQATQLGAVQTQVDTVVEQTKPVVVVPTPPAPIPPLSVRQQALNKVAEMSALCSRTSWTDTFKQIQSWWNSPERTESEKFSVYAVENEIDSWLVSQHEAKILNEQVKSASSFCDTASYSSKTMAGCQVVAAVQAPYMACVLDQ